MSAIRGVGDMKAPRRATVLWLCAHIVAWALLVLTILVAVPRFEAIFKEFGVPLSYGARATISLSHLVVRLAPLVSLVLVALLAGDWFALEEFRRRRDPGASFVWALFVLITPLFLLGFAVASLGLIMLTVETHLSG